ncbi:auxin-responsive protein SAUR71-like [Carya illinoinensis]|uniref:Small auxin up regulated protein n=2 Tax=Carya illinoinensis TaxID=32201 RepID=A0A8T1NZT3_CARIL|nr:auxin-responsive protein SAUR71-like [Carya illinoinensis]KAG6634894.1 hypothetical protein CIPAW_11G004000 [Carya illinoinensis]
MDVVKSKWKKNPTIRKAWERCRSVGTGRKTNFNSLTKSKSWKYRFEEDNMNISKKTCQVAPEGCFSVYVGPQRQRFVVKTKFANHPLFVMLLEEAELEYGYNSEGPILLPCEVDTFNQVVAEIDGEQQRGITNHGCSFAIG